MRRFTRLTNGLVLFQFEIALRFWVPKGRNLVAVGERSDTHGMRAKKKAPDPARVKHLHECDPFQGRGDNVEESVGVAALTHGY